MMGTDKKINEMLRKGKADNSVQQEYNLLKNDHSMAKLNKNAKESTMLNASKDFENKAQAMSNISLLHPFKKYRAYRAMQLAKNQYKIAKEEYKIAKQNLKKAQRQLRTMRSEIRGQYNAINKNEKMERRVQKMQRDNHVSLSLQDVLEFNKQNNFYKTAQYHVDRNDLKNNRYISPPRDELYKNINKAYANHLKEKAKSKLKDVKENIVDKTRQFGEHLKNNEPELEM